jgi:hypothetical protein
VRVCTVEGCDKKHRSNGYCNTHYMRWKQSGTPLGRPWVTRGVECSRDGCARRTEREDGICARHVTKGRPSGERAYQWLGDDISYASAHARVRRTRGRASSQTCVDCGERADHWAYNNESEKERTDPVRGLNYSPDPDDYDPRCAACHAIHDNRRNDTCEDGHPIIARAGGRRHCPQCKRHRDRSR